MSKTYDHAGNTRYDEVTDEYTEPTEAERLAWVEMQVKVLCRQVGVLQAAHQLSSGGAVDRDAPC